MIPVSMLDWEGRLCCVLFLSKCNLRCPFCHNGPLLSDDPSLPDLDFEEVAGHLSKKRDWIDGVCVTGGEPTLNERLVSLLSALKNLVYQVKLDTNGTKPDVLKDLIEAGLVDYVALDVKSSFDKYAYATSRPDASAKVKRSIELLLSGQPQVEVEFRTTVVPQYVEPTDIISIAGYLAQAGARKYVLQQFEPSKALEPEARAIKPYTSDQLNELADECSVFLPTHFRA